ncbi:type VI secretion system tip protein VgrG [Loktanella sp. F6476L]|uniref:type VI secretion system Vgr family protein n=1 Tax=Loktanella sp. F6476L TaxID=2926405 RepID=UPI001FF50BC2|nr:type VI secretion system tip protein TssI/VgrG [Loktanella sp. F6476L]MCK0122439.1 type VI secretion system tip protein VgrG [Loktanella sp. F6476L]
MNARFSQDTRLGSLTTALGDKDLVLLQFTGTDYLNDLFEYRVEALSQQDDIDLNALMGTHATVKIASQKFEDRYFDGIVTHACWAGTTKSGQKYALTLRPWFWLAGLRRNQRIFHKMTVRQILAELFSSYSALGSPAFIDKLNGNYPELEYTVQYRESDLAFATRMMERFGISYHFTFSENSHTLVMTDSIDEHAAIDGKTREFKPNEGHHAGDQERFWQWLPEQNITTGAIRLTDYNFKKPTAMMEVDQIGDAGHAHGQIESFDYPGDFLEQAIGKAVSGLRVMQERGGDVRHRAQGDCISLSAGMRIGLKGDPVAGATDKEFVCLQASHDFRSEAYGTVTEVSDDPFTGAYTFMPVNAPLAPDRKTPRPVVQGPQTAVVVGEGEIDCDEYGRVLVRFHWDLDNAYSMRCRVSQNWAHRGYGGMVIPRIGMEVVVEFLEGDPDKPLISGCVYNGRNMPPYDLPGNKTKSVFKSDTHQGEGFNELTFEDQKDREMIYMHGQKDQQIDILNDRSKNIGRDQQEGVGRDKSITIGRDHTETVGQDAKHTIMRDVMYEVKQNQQEKYGKDHIHYVGNIHKQDIYADFQQKIGKNSDRTILGRSVLNVTEAITNNTKTHTLMAYDKFIIKAPGAKITMSSGNITLEASTINLKGNVSMGGGGSAQVPTLQGAANEGLPLVEECLAQLGDEG